jgi:hypothetical protein
MDEFDNIVKIIEAGFNPKNVSSEEEAEKELIHFLNSRFPNKTLGQGHTSTGLRIDIVIEGTYAIELVTLETESRLVLLLEQIVKSREEFIKIAVVLVNLGNIPIETIENYKREYEKLGVKTVVKEI